MSEVMRAEFEDAYAKRFSRPPLEWNPKLRCYMDTHAAGAWWAWQVATLKAFGDGHRAGFESGMKANHEFDEARIDRIASSHGDGEHYGDLK